MRVPAAGGTPQPLTTLDSSNRERSHRWPQVLPQGKGVLFNSGDLGGNAFESVIRVAALKAGAGTALPLRGAFPRYIPGYLVFARREGLFAAPFDLQKLAVTGSAFPVGEVLTSAIGGASFSISDTGTLTYVPAGANIGKLAWVDAKGPMEMFGAPARDYFQRVQLSPDGKRVVVVIQEGGWRDIWVYDIPRGSLTRLTFGNSDNSGPTWSADGRRVVFQRSKGGNYSLVAKPADGSGSEETLLPAQSLPTIPAAWSPDGKALAYWQLGSTGKWEMWILPLAGDRKPQVLLANQFDNLPAGFSPDGKYLAYTSNETGASRCT